MKDPEIRRMSDLPSTRLMGTGLPTCSGCGGIEAIHQIYDILGKKTVFVNAAGCMTLLAIYPYTPLRGSWLYTAMASAPAGAQGVRDALDILIEKKRLPSDEDMNVVVLSGDGSANGMGLSATSSAIDRGMDFIYICYDNEGYGNTGQQFSGATPHGARTSTSTGSTGYPGRKKDLFSIWEANRPAYLATVIGSEPLDLARKVEKAKSIKGPRLLIAMAPCPTGWGFDPARTVEIGKLAVKTGVWPLKEYHEGKTVHTMIPKKRPSVEEYLMTQRRFAHLFKPQRNEKLISGMQDDINAYWQKVKE